MKPRRRILGLGIFLLLVVTLSGWVLNSSAVAADAMAAFDDSIAAPHEVDIDTGDNAWILTSSALVLMMTGPGLALFYCGLVRKKNVLSVMMQCIFLMGVMAVVWAVLGYTLAFGGEEPWIGNLDYLLLNGVQGQWVEPSQLSQVQGDVHLIHCRGVDAVQVVPMAGSIPRLTHMLFQGMFFIITPALICGAFAERMKFSAMVLFMMLWGLLVYCPLCHWIWGGGCLTFGGEGAIAGGTLDFAGGAVVHISSGVSALICALLIGKRLGFGSEPMPPHNMTYTAIGAALLWVGWFGFNGGSALAANSLAASAFAVTHFGAAAGAIAWAGWEWILRGKPSVLGACSGLVAGLAGVTATTGYVQPIHGILIGALCASACYYACTVVKNKFGYDDSLDVFGVHGVSGIVGMTLVGVFATRAVTDPAVSGGQPLGLIEGGSIITGQLATVAIASVFSIAVTFVLLRILDTLIGLRVSEKEEIEGLDFSEHGEEGYILL
ncbi:MAG TPA: ammonium transporter [Thermoguttaceae bacterium]|nr:ammonium transporter [Thermoguttaceae bacterium]